MKKSIILIIITAVLAMSFSAIAVAEDSSTDTPKLEYDGLTITPDYPASTDCYIIAYQNTPSDDVWSSKLYSYDYIMGIPPEAQRVYLVSFTIEDGIISATDSRNVVYTLNASTGELLHTDTTDYSEPSFSVADTSGDGSSGSDESNQPVVRYLLIFVVAAGILVFIAARKRTPPSEDEKRVKLTRKKRK